MLVVLCFLFLWDSHSSQFILTPIVIFCALIMFHLPMYDKNGKQEQRGLQQLVIVFRTFAGGHAP